MPDQHIVTAYDAELRRLGGQIAEMGGLAETLVADSVAALSRNDLELAQRVITHDKRLDQMQRTVEEEAILLIAKRQPMATDLREVISFMRIANDLERVGDLAKNIAKRVIAIDSPIAHKQFLVGVQHLVEIALEQLANVLNAYSNREDGLARAVRDRDTDIDALYTSLFRELLTYMMEDPRNIGQCTHLLFSAKNIERIGDHATNIAETVHYAITGEMWEGDRPKADTTSVESLPVPG
ncbi:Negative regulator of Pho regulon [Hartmannibacter diazotrophicus]|uniref:Phosphate-specific transport system accessory protein PhoU n=1 Tax=Hartmannibacter diazotrophicus TaxID=1482074 RepID=A0A2C9D1K0_9HYPH|nr:phosphate signaling complex protein PhoU [Hartmannibacter diazotrophicus]SON54103.1 Negative regulator of Pho regulon [Hartmannibacter diazotrophicus]